MSARAAGPASVDLLSAGNFTILSKTGITNTGSHMSAITGNIGSSPVTAAAMNNVFCSEITGTIYGVDSAYVGSGSQTCFMGNPPLANKTLVDVAVLDMGTAYADASGRTNPTATELGAGIIGGLTIAPGLYKWSSDVTIPTNVTLSGSENDVWIFQIAGNLNVASAGSLASGTKVLLSGGAKASNVFWQVGGVTGATLGTYSTFNGSILSAKQIIVETGAVVTGRLMAQTQVTLDASAVTAPPASTPSPAPAPQAQYNASAETAASPTFNADKGMTLAPSSSCPSDTLVKGSGPAVYYCGQDGKRYVFPNEKTYFTWYADFSTVTTISDAALASVMIGGNVTYRPGVRMIKINTDPKVYAVAKGGTLRWVSSEAIAASLYGSNWNAKIDDLSDAFFVNYTTGAPITQ